jgi:hypothetical protein
MEIQARCILCKNIDWVPIEDKEKKCMKCYDKCVFCLKTPGKEKIICRGQYVGMAKIFRMCDDLECIKEAIEEPLKENIMLYYRHIPYKQIRYQTTKCELCEEFKWFSVDAKKYGLKLKRCWNCLDKCVLCLKNPGKSRSVNLNGEIVRHRFCDSAECWDIVLEQRVPDKVKRYYHDELTALREVKDTEYAKSGHNECHCGAPASKLECGKYRCDRHDDCTCWTCSH